MEKIKILITGNTGMVGRNLIEANTKYTLLIPKRAEFDLLNYQQVVDYLNTHKPGMIIHAAGKVGGIQANIENPVNFFVENLFMGHKLIVAAYNAGIENILNLGSSCMYPVSDEPLKEDMILSGKLEPTNEGYALAKIGVMKLCEYFNRQYGTNYKTIIPCNLFGKYDKFGEDSHMIASAINKLHNKDFTIWGDGTARREFMFAGDLAEIIWKYVDRFNEMPEVMNVGTGKDYTVKQYYRAIAGMMKIEGEFTLDLTRPVGTKRKLLDISLQKKYDLTHKHTLKEGLKKTYEYYLSTIK